jgi:hypothetical protein
VDQDPDTWLFVEIQKLGIEQRKSLLLNMTDGYGFSVKWFVFTGLQFMLHCCCEIRCRFNNGEQVK